MDQHMISYAAYLYDSRNAALIACAADCYWDTCKKSIIRVGQISLLD